MSFASRSFAAVLLLVPSSAMAQIVAQPAPPPPLADTSTAVAMSAAFRAAAERTLPAVVFIAIEQAPLAMREQPPAFRDVLPAPMQPPPRQGTGSGVIIDAEGHVLTNNHVVADATRLTVRLVDGREYTATLVGSDVSTDIAVIKIDPRRGESLPVAELGVSSALEVGDWVLALGNPLGLTFTVTAGIVSATGRQISTASTTPTLESFIQTDAVINPGNSGGPLIDLLGRVVGINSAIFGSDRFVGYGFAVPIDIARRVMSDLLEFGYLRRPRLGVAIAPVTAVEAELYRLPEVRGAVVVNVEAGQAADRAGIRLADIIVALNGMPIMDDADLISQLAQLRPNQDVTLTIIREGRPQDVRVRLGEFERGPAPQVRRETPRPELPEQVLGFTLADLTPDVAQRAGYRGEGGAMVRNLVQYSAAYRAGLREGMVVLSINNRRIRSSNDARSIVRDIEPGSPVALIVYDPERGETLVTFRAMQ